MAISARLVVKPTEALLEVLKSRLRPRVVKDFNGAGALLLIQGAVVDVLAAIDVATKASNVKASEVVGNCPQQLNTVVFWGSVSDVKQALSALKEWGDVKP
ncbi:microcompartments protein [Thermovirga lienii DSM 17291]|uniref:Microcompartments protein n=1 Tax=Thermovirga lienii (strain ATCC BAA-1197 / DSM 17291 / Cas60314) TaxID=580340 RepID=G7V6C1_THELD|nr:BMC domain-containing protein [Thermovirga lienii]AER65950.1 microcompartments protein [Thermovirga lienii DSM 17291]